MRARDNLWVFVRLFIAGAIATAFAAGCVAEPQGQTTPAAPRSPAPAGATTASLTPTPPRAPSPSPARSPVPSPTPTAIPVRFRGYDLALKPGTFWRYRWTYEKTSCAQGSGCSRRSDDGEFVITLGSPQIIQGAQMYPLEVSGSPAVTLPKETRDFTPRWAYVGVDGNRIVVSNGATLATLFDAGSGRWAGGGFFTDRFASDELIVASSSPIDDRSGFASWSGFRTGPAESVGRSASQSQCEIIAGQRICPRETAYGSSEREYYRAGIGPLAYIYDYSSSFSGGGFSSSSAWKERVALVASSLRGDTPLPTPTPTPDPTSGGTRELEPNDTPGQAQQLGLAIALRGDIQIGDRAGGPEVRVEVDGADVFFTAEDHYRFDLPGAATVRIALDLDAGIRDGVTVGLLLWDGATGEPIGAAFDPGHPSVGLELRLQGGRYFAGVTASETPRGRVTYTLRVDAGP